MIPVEMDDLLVAQGLMVPDILGVHLYDLEWLC
jgi:hypothetical protein